jgi:phosphoenolpyruvate carboxylase
MARLLGDERYRRHLRGRNDRQIVMLGYADANLDGGVVAASWSLHKAQRALRDTAQEYGVALTVFHGRGGTISQAGRRINDALVATVTGAQPAPLRMTETGERISARYGLRGIAIRTLEQTVGSLLQVVAVPPDPDQREEAWNTIMQTLADESRRAFRQLVDLSGEFARYFRDATPIDVIERLNMIVERDRDEDERSPTTNSRRWEYAWVQNRCLMPAWFGFAQGVNAALDQHGPDAVREMFADWPFARVLIADIELSLAKTDIGIARRYSILARDLHERFFPIIEDEFQASVERVLYLSGQTKLLENSPTLRRAIRLRNPYVDPMSVLQIDLLRRWRTSDRKDDAVLQALRASINGIPHGMQNTG